MKELKFLNNMMKCILPMNIFWVLYGLYLCINGIGLGIIILFINLFACGFLLKAIKLNNKTLKDFKNE